MSSDTQRARLEAMCDAIRHRGPNSAGYYHHESVALGMRRLSIIDVAGGDQPIYNEDNSVVVVYNGEIYNHHDLRAGLEKQGHHFRTRSDTEVLVHLYEEYGDNMVARLNGMFGFALWDNRQSRLLVCRDRSGMKPLSYRITAGGLVFGSELRSMLAFDAQLFKVDAASVAKFLAFGYVPEPRTIFADTHKLPAAHYMTWERARGVEVHRYWTPPRAHETGWPENELVTEVTQLLDQAVASHLESEVPLGAFLSGGLDSSTVVALMCRHASGRVRTFSIGFAERDFDESAAARDVARALGTEHTDLIVKPDVERLFEDIVSVFDEPFADASAIPTFLVAQLAKQQVTVALSGDGGDELFGGYSRYSEVLRARQNWKRFSPSLFAPLVRKLPFWLRGRNWLLNQTRSEWGRYASTVVEPVRLDEGGLASASSPGGSDLVEEQLLGVVPMPKSSDFAADMMLLDFCTYLPGDILTKVDRTSMAVSLEARVPLLDSRLTEFALRLPGSRRVSARNSKILFRKAIEGIVPDSVLSRPKQGFGIPLAKWFRGPLRERSERLRDRAAGLAEYVDPSALDRLVSEHLLGRRDNSGLMWRVMVLGAWLDALSNGAMRKPPSIGSIGKEEIRRGHD